MKRFLPYSFILGILFLLGSEQNLLSQVALPHYDGFEYTSGSALQTQGGWTANNTGDDLLIAEGNLSYPGYIASKGNRVIFNGAGIDAYKSVVQQTTGTVYFSFILKVTNVTAATNTDGGYFIGLGQNTTTFGATVWLKKNGDNFNIGINTRTAVAVTSYSAEAFAVNTEILVVGSYQLNSSASDDIATLWINPPSTSFGSTTVPTPTLTVTNTGGTDLSNISSVFIRQDSDGETPFIEMDELRISTAWESVVPLTAVADLTAPVFSAGFPKTANIDATQADIQVNMDEAGKAYYIMVPDGATAPTAAEVYAGADYGTVTLTAHGTIDVIAPGTTYSATVTGLTDKTNYDIYVVAEDDEAAPNRQAAPVMIDLYTIRPPDVLLNADFETAGSLAPFTQVSVTGDQVWAQSTNSGNGFAKMSGYSTAANENNDWLISPAINLASAEMNAVSFMTATSFTGPALKVMISSNFDGTYTPAGVTSGTVTWTDITSNFSFSSGTYTWVPSGEYSLAAYTGTVYIAFVYESSSTQAATWEVDDFRVTGYLLPGSDASLSDLMVDGTTVTGFDPATLEYKVSLPAGTTVVPAVTYATNDPAANAVVTAATDLAGTATARTTTIVVTAADGITTVTYKVLFDPIVVVANLAALRAVAVADYDRTYQISGEVVVTGLNSTQRGQKYIQDASAAVLVDDPTGIITTTYAVGDGITGLTGTLMDYFDMLEFVPSADPGTASSTGKTVAVQTLTVSEFKTNFESYESELVKITGIDFTAANGTLAFETKKNYDVTVGTDATVVRTVFLSTDLTGTVIPNMADVTGIAVWDFSAAKIAPRNLADLNIYSADASLSDLKVNGTTVTGFVAATLTYNVSLPSGTTVIPTVTATATDAAAGVTVVAATSLTGDAAARTAKVNVTSHDLSVTKQYTIVFTVATGIEETGAGNIRIYPVPAHSDIFAENITDVTLIEIFDVTGNKHISEAVNGQDQIRIPVSHLARGVYFIRLTTEKGNVMKRFIKD